MSGHDHPSLSDVELRVRSLESLLVEKGLLTTEEIDARAAGLHERWG